MRPKTYVVVASAGGTTYSPAYVVDTYENPCNIGIGIVIIGAGSAICDVQHTFSDPNAINLSISTNGVWLNNATLSSATANGDTNYAYPPRAIRFAIRAAASAQVTGTIVQSGPEA